MASQVNNYKCPACTGPLQFSGDSGQVECEYCGSKFTVSEIEEMYAEVEQKAQEAFEEGEKAPEQNEPWEFEYNSTEWNEEGLKTYGCPSCGAELICEETTAATSCPYCGNPTIIPGQFAGGLKPDLVIPFKLSKKEAVEKLKAHYKGFFLPKQFASENHLEEVKGVYVPFWLYNGTASGEMIFKASRSRVRTTSKERITTTDHFIVERRGSMEFAQIPADASKKMPDDYMESIEPFDYSELKEFSTAYLPGFLADKYDVEQKDCIPRIEERCRQSVIDTLTATVHGYTSCVPVSTKTKLEKGEVKYALMPVWLLSTQWQGQNYLFAMNGQTGKMVGDLPIDKKKRRKLFAIIWAVITVLGFVIFV